MSIDMYKQLNEELVNSVQELKGRVMSLERELVAANGNLLDEVERRVSIEQKCQSIITRFKKSMRALCNEALIEFNSDVFPLTPPERAHHKNGVGRRSSLGITMRSPLRTISPKESPNEQQQQQQCLLPATIAEEAVVVAVQSLCGLSNLEERSENTGPTSKENTENEATDSSSCQSVDTMPNQTTSQSIMIAPNIMISEPPAGRSVNRRTSQVWDRNVLRAKQLSPNPAGTSSANVSGSLHVLAATASYTISPKDVSNNNSLDRLTVDFSENLCLHSTPRCTENLTSTVAPSENEDQTLTSSYARPRRKCAPKTLVERPLCTKLRNEAPKRQTKRRKGTNKTNASSD